MKRTFFVSLALLVFVGLLAAGCTPPSRAENGPPAEAEVTVPAEETAEVTAEAAEEEAAAAAEEEPPAEPEAEDALILASTQPESNCLDCHTDAELLQATAEEEEEVESLSEGSG